MLLADDHTIVTEGLKRLLQPHFEIVEAVEDVTPEVAKDLRPADLKAGKALGELTARERQVIRLVAEGKSAKEIAAVLNISVKTATLSIQSQPGSGSRIEASVPLRNN